MELETFALSVGRLKNDFDLKAHNCCYKLCDNCGHFNGANQITSEFVDYLYKDSNGEAYANNYVSNQAASDFSSRVEKIYKPKAAYLLDVLGTHFANKKNTSNSNDRLEIDEISVLDIGCGSGFFVAALLDQRCKAVGIDVNKTMVDWGNKHLTKSRRSSPLKHVDDKYFLKAVENTSSDVISAIGVIEHLQSPRDFFDAFKASRASYLFYSVPMLSLSVFLEQCFPDAFPRQLCGGHTHLFTESSIEEMNKQLGAISVAEWRFGVDAMDLYRSMMTTLKNTNMSAKLFADFEDNFITFVDPIQEQLDRGHWCSEIHVIAAKEQS